MDYTAVPGPAERNSAPVSETLGAITSIQRETIDVMADVMVSILGANPPAQEKTEIRCMMDAVKSIEERTKMIFDMALRMKQALC